MEGFLTKRGHIVQNWKVRWFTLVNNELSYYKDQTQKLHKGKVILQKTTVIDDHPDMGPHKNVMVINVSGKDKEALMVSADNEKVRNTWYYSLKIAIAKLNNNQEDIDKFSTLLSNLTATRSSIDSFTASFISSEKINIVEEPVAPVVEKSSRGGFKNVNSMPDSDDDEEVEIEIDEEQLLANLKNQNNTSNNNIPNDGSYVEDERGIKFNSNLQFADQTVDVLRRQLMKEGKVPMEYIPLSQLKAELNNIFSCANNGLPYDEGRLDYLLMCMDFNPEYAKEKEEENNKWRNEIGPYVNEALEIMKGHVPPHIFHASINSLVEEDGMCMALAKRLMTKKCLWLVRVSASDIERMHIAELRGRFNPEAQGLDIIETAAIYAAIPNKFNNDSDGKKERWRASLEQNLKAMYLEKQANKLAKLKQRNPAYAKQESLYAHRETMHSMSVISSEDAFKPRDSFRNIKLTAEELASIQEGNVGDEDEDEPNAFKVQDAKNKNRSNTNAPAPINANNNSNNNTKVRSMTDAPPPAPDQPAPRPARLSSSFAGISDALNKKFAQGNPLKKPADS